MGNPETLPLTDGIIPDALVMTKHLAVRVDNIPRIFINLQQILVIPGIKILALFNVIDCKPHLPRQRLDFRLVIPSDGKQNLTQLFLRQPVDKIGLVLFKISGLFQNIPLVLFTVLHAGVMSGSKVIIGDSRLFCHQGEHPEFDQLVALDAWIRRSTGQVF